MADFARRGNEVNIFIFVKLLIIGDSKLFWNNAST